MKHCDKKNIQSKSMFVSSYEMLKYRDCNYMVNRYRLNGIDVFGFTELGIGELGKVMYRWRIGKTRSSHYTNNRASEKNNVGNQHRLSTLNYSYSHWEENTRKSRRSFRTGTTFFLPVVCVPT